MREGCSSSCKGQRQEQREKRSVRRSSNEVKSNAVLVRLSTSWAFMFVLPEPLSYNMQPDITAMVETLEVASLPSCSLRLLRYALQLGCVRNLMG